MHKLQKKSLYMRSNFHSAINLRSWTPLGHSVHLVLISRSSCPGANNKFVNVNHFKNKLYIDASYAKVFCIYQVSENQTWCIFSWYLLCTSCWLKQLVDNFDNQLASIANASLIFGLMIAWQLTSLLKSCMFLSWMHVPPSWMYVPLSEVLYFNQIF